MIYCLTGENEYLVSEELNKLRQLEDYSGGLNVAIINPEDVSLEELKMDLMSLSLFSEERLIILNQPSKVKGFSDDIEEISNGIPSTTKVVIVEPTLDKRKTYYKYLSAKTEFKVLNNLNIAALAKWAVDYAKNNGGDLSSSSASYLIDRVGDNQLLLSQDIVKLILYSKQITKDSIDLLTVRSPSSTVFELLDAAFELNSKKALGIYKEQRSQKVEPEQILAMLSWQLNIVAIYMTSKKLSDSEVLSVSRMSPYTLNKAKRISTKLSPNNLKKLVSELSYLDVQNKTTSLDLDEGLKNFIVSLVE
jgi:DNA polymerase-3 subunit delta